MPLNKTIPNLSSVDTWDPQSKTLKLSDLWNRWFVSLITFLTTVIDFTNATVTVPLTGFSIQIGDTTQVLTLNPAGTLATGFITMPAKPVDGQQLEILSTQTITALTLSPSGTQTVYNAPTTLVGGLGVSFYYNGASNSWFRRR